MNRLGYTPESFRAAWERARACQGVGQITLMTHFSDADGERGVAYQMEAFERGAQGIAGARSLANSAATLWHPARAFRLGAAGHHPVRRVAVGRDGGHRRHRPAAGHDARLRTDRCADGRRRAKPSATARSLRAGGPMRIGVVACGYADGYPRCAPEGTPVIVDGVRTRVVGRVSMDMLTVDLTPCPTANVGSRVELWGHTSAHRRRRAGLRHDRLRADVRGGASACRCARSRPLRSARFDVLKRISRHSCTIRHHSRQARARG